MKKIISLVLSVIMVLSCTVYVSAAEITETENTIYTGDTTLKVIGEYTEDNKDEIIRSILENDPNALIFTSLEEYEAYVKELQNVTVTVNASDKYRSVDNTMHIAMTIGLSKVNVYYDYALYDNGTVYKIYQDTVRSSMTGLSPGVTYQQNRLSVTKKDSMHILSDLSYTLTYYLIADYLIQVGTEDFRYQFTHDVTTNGVTFKQIV